MKRLIGITAVFIAVAAIAQGPVTVSASAQVQGQTITFTLKPHRVPLLTYTSPCATDFDVPAGRTVDCVVVFNLPAKVDTVIPLTGPPDFTIPATVTLKAGSNSVTVPVTATP